MEKEIDLRPYIQSFARRWYWIIGLPLAAAIIAGYVAFSSPPTYSATAIVTAVDTREVVELSPEITEILGKQPLAAFPALALSDEVLNDTLENLSLELSLAEFKEILESTSGADNSIILLTVNSKDAELGARIANVWANSFVNWANRVYQGQGGERLEFFESQLEAASQALAKAERELEQFQSVNQTKIISNTLGIYQQTHVRNLKERERFSQLLKNTQALHTQILKSPNDKVTYADQLTYLQLQLQAYNNNTDDDDVIIPIILSLDSGDVLSEVNRAEQIQTVDNLLATLEEKLNQIEVGLQALEPRILTLQGESQAALAKQNTLFRNVNMAQQIYTTLSFQVAEEQIIAQDSNGGFRLASNAAVSGQPTESRPLLSAIAVGLIVFVFLSIWLLFITWWRTSFAVTD